LFARDIYYPLASSTLVAKSPTYETILELDRKVREVNFPSTYDPYPKKEVIGEEMYVDSEMTMRDFYVSQHRSVSKSSLPVSKIDSHKVSDALSSPQLFCPGHVGPPGEPTSEQVFAFVLNGVPQCRRDHQGHFVHV